MSKYPRAFGIFTPDGWWELLYEDNHTANLDANHKYERGDFTGCEVVELISLPEHESLVAAAVAAERERLTSIIRSINPCDIEDSRPTFAGATLRYVLANIREVPE